jgi:hypothetical protein
MTVENARMTRRVSAAAIVAASAMALSGCVGMAPTYGTGKPADTQLMEDVSSMFSLTPKKKEQIDYKPRPELVKPAKADALPAPQDNITTASAGAWPESPEARLKRIRDDATANRDDPNFQPEVELDTTNRGRKGVRSTRGDDINADGSSISIASQRKEFNERLAMTRQGSPTERRYLSEPPIEYRQPAATAPVDDVGEDEWKKDRRRKAGHTKKSSSWWPF